MAKKKGGTLTLQYRRSLRWVPDRGDGEVVDRPREGRRYVLLDHDRDHRLVRFRVQRRQGLPGGLKMRNFTYCALANPDKPREAGHQEGEYCGGS